MQLNLKKMYFTFFLNNDKYTFFCYSQANLKHFMYIKYEAYQYVL